MKLAIAAAILLCATSASAQELTVKIVDRQDNETDYTYVVPRTRFASIQPGSAVSSSSLVWRWTRRWLALRSARS
jgi:hypothetical protein